MIHLFGDIIERNISKRIFYSICIVAVAVSLLDFLFKFISEISDISNSYLVLDALIYCVYSIPSSIYEYLSYVCLIGVIVGLGSLNSEGEIIGSKVLGKSNFKMAIASLRPAILIIALAFLFQETFLPSLSQSNEENRLVKQDRINSEDGYWFASNSSISFFKTSPSKDSINDVTTYQYGEEGNINQITDSKYAKRQNGIWTLFDLTVTDFQKNSILFQEEKIWPEGPKDSDMRRILSPRYLSIGELNEALKLNISEYRRNNLSLEYWKKIFHPITTILLILLAASFVFGRVRDDSIGKRILAGVLFAFSLNICQNLFASMAAVSLLSPFYAVTLPIAGVIVLTTIFWKLKSN